MAQLNPQPPWWQNAVFYEIYVRSFQDSNDDGIGDLNGITSRLDYLVDLGVDALWLTPFYASPQVDFGYDISDHRAVDPTNGTLADFDRLVSEAHRRGLKVVLDLVLNHTSDQHPWFLSSRSSRDSPYRDWYVWRDPVNGQPPNNWVSAFGPSAWTLDEATGQYYYHFFYPQQPDLNWRNPAVEGAMFDMVQFWLDRGADGFRLDAIRTLVEDASLRDNPMLNTLRPGSTVEREQVTVYNVHQPETLEIIRRLRALVRRDGNERALIGEAHVPDLEHLVWYYGEADALDLAFEFFFGEIPRLDAAAFRRHISACFETLGSHPPARALSSHDIPRALSRFDPGEADRPAVAKMLATVLLTLPGVPFVYYGEEIGMVNTDPTSVDQVQDPLGRRYWPGEKGRDGERTPMQWTGAPHAGFSNAEPWLPVPASARTINVEAQRADPNSILSFYRELLRVGRDHPALRLGDYATVGDDPNVFAYTRRGGGETILVTANTSPERQPLRLPFLRQPMRPLLGTPASGPESLEPYGAAIWLLEGQ